MNPDLKVVARGDPIRQQAAAWFARLRADDLSEAETRRWRAWLDEDPRHRSAYERLERLWSAVGEFAPAPEIARRLDAGAGPETRNAAGGAGRRRWAGWRAAAAAAVTAAAIGTWTLSRLPMAADAEYVTAVGEHRSMTLEDGTRVTLDTDTRLRVAYSDKARDMTLERGRAFFRVAKDARPLSVHAGRGSVRALGTEFEVYRHERELEVALIEGEVLLLPADGDDAAQAPVRMAAGQRARLGDGSAAPRIEALRTTAPPAWLSGRLVFEDTPLPEVAAEFNRYNHDRIVLDGDRLSQVRITGVFRNDAVQAFVGALCEAYPIAMDASVPGVLRLRHDPSAASKPARGRAAPA